MSDVTSRKSTRPSEDQYRGPESIGPRPVMGGQRPVDQRSADYRGPRSSQDGQMGGQNQARPAVDGANRSPHGLSDSRNGYKLNSLGYYERSGDIQTVKLNSSAHGDNKYITPGSTPLQQLQRLPNDSKPQRTSNTFDTSRQGYTPEKFSPHARRNNLASMDGNKYNNDSAFQQLQRTNDSRTNRGTNFSSPERSRQGSTPEKQSSQYSRGDYQYDQYRSPTVTSPSTSNVSYHSVSSNAPSSSRANFSSPASVMSKSPNTRGFGTQDVIRRLYSSQADSKPMYATQDSIQKLYHDHMTNAANQQGALPASSSSSHQSPQVSIDMQESLSYI